MAMVGLVAKSLLVLPCCWRWAVSQAGRAPWRVSAAKRRIQPRSSGGEGRGGFLLDLSFADPLGNSFKERKEPRYLAYNGLRTDDLNERGVSLKSHG